MKRILVLAAMLGLSLCAAAQTTGASSGSTSAAQTEIQNVGSPIINTYGAEHMRTDFHSNQAATAATVFVNPPAADTCAMPGSGLSVQLPGGGAAGSLGGEASVRCEMRADVLNLKVTGAPAEVVKARQCMDERMSEAYARAGMPCTDKRPQQAVATAPRQGEPTDPYVRARMGLPVAGK